MLVYRALLDGYFCMCIQRWRRDDADIRMLEHAVRSDGDDADHNDETWSTVNQEEKQMTYDEVEPDYFNLNLTKEVGLFTSALFRF